MATPRKLSLTPELVARVHRDIVDAGPAPGIVPMTEADYNAVTEMVLAAAPDPKDVLVFACGSLIWRPSGAIDGQYPALLRGWRRNYCLLIHRWRGTPDQPGLMMGLDRGGACRGVVQRIAGNDVASRIGELVRREMSVKPATQGLRWVTVESQGETVPAIAICVDRKGPNYCGDAPIETVVGMLARACGHWGSCAEYLMNTVDHLERLGIHDRYLWQLQERVAAHIRANDAG